MSQKPKVVQQCDLCLYYAEDQETGEYYCSMNMDQDEIEKVRYNRSYQCTYFRIGNDYTIVKRQGFKSS